MPIYEYQCQNAECKKIVISKSTKYKPTEYHTKLCECGSKHRIKISNSVFQLKGGGWAKDEYNKK